MEIFAEIDSNTKLVKVTNQELMTILGYKSRYDNGWNDRYLDVGKILPIEQFSKISADVKLLNTKLLKEMLERLNRATSLITEAVEKADEMNCFEKLKDGT